MRGFRVALGASVLGLELRGLSSRALLVLVGSSLSPWLALGPAVRASLRTGETDATRLASVILTSPGVIAVSAFVALAVPARSSHASVVPEGIGSRSRPLAEWFRLPPSTPVPSSPWAIIPPSVRGRVPASFAVGVGLRAVRWRRARFRVDGDGEPAGQLVPHHSPSEFGLIPPVHLMEGAVRGERGANLRERLALRRHCLRLRHLAR